MGLIGRISVAPCIILRLNRIWNQLSHRLLVGYSRPSKLKRLAGQYFMGVQPLRKFGIYYTIKHNGTLLNAV